MTSTLEPPIYASADGYETPIHLKHHPHDESALKAIQNRKPISWLAVDETDRGPPPPRGMYRNIAYF
ncbi:hypothetical protein OSTOST_23760 [Ostertagia ostertagi]